MCTSLLDQEAWEEAEEFILDGMAHFPQSSKLAWSLAWLYLQTQRKPEALSVIRKTSDLTKSLREIQIMTAFCLIENGEFAPAILSLQQLTKPEGVPIYWTFLLGYSFLHVGRQEKAIETFKRYLQLNNNRENRFSHYIRIQLQHLSD